MSLQSQYTVIQKRFEEIRHEDGSEKKLAEASLDVIYDHLYGSVESYTSLDGPLLKQAEKYYYTLIT